MDGKLVQADTAKIAAESAKALAEIAKSGADTAKTDAQTAQTLAESAKAAAETAQGIAATAKTDALLAKSASETAKDNAVAAQSASESAKTNAQDWASKISGAVTGGEMSAKYHAQTASTDAGTATTKAAAASVSEGNALASKNTAEMKATQSAVSAAASATSESAASSSESNAGGSASTATTKASDAAGSATAAASSATAAASSNTNSASSASAASTSATAAASSASTAASTLSDRYTKAETDAKIVALSPPTDITSKFDKTGGTISGNTIINGSVKLGADTRTAPTAGAGTLRWSNGKLQSSDGAEWKDVNYIPPKDGSSSEQAGSSCYKLKTTMGVTSSGAYWIIADGTPRQVYCDMTTDGGGWTLVWKVQDPGGHGNTTHLGEGYQSNIFEDRGNFQSLYDQGGGNIPGKVAIAQDGVSQQRLMASFNSTVKWDWKGNLNSNLGSTNDGISIHNSGGATAIYDVSGNSITPDYSCNADGNVGNHWYGIDKSSPGNCSGNCDFGWATDCRWENSPSVTNHTQMTMHIFVK
jgi:hypothetical protein